MVKKLNVKGNLLGAAFGVIIISVFALVGFGGAAFGNPATHESSASVVPGWSGQSEMVDFTVTVTNSGPDSVNHVKITIPTSPYPYSELACGDAPEGWTVEGEKGYCQYHTSSSGHYIEAGNSLDFMLSARTAPEDGMYTWEVVTWDVPGSWFSSNPETGIDTTDPESYAEGLPEYETAAVFDIDYAAWDVISGVEEVELFYRRDGGPYTSYGAFTSSPVAFNSSGTGGDGFYEFYTIARDYAGNEEEAPLKADAGTTVDTAPPGIIIYDIENPEFSPNSDGIKETVTIDLKFSEKVDYDIIIKKDLIVYKSWSGTATNPFPKAWNGKHEVNGSWVVAPDGVYTIEVVMEDMAGHMVTDDSGAIILDTEDPNAAEVTAPADGSLVGALVHIEANAEDGLAGIERVEFYHDSSGPVLICTDYEAPYGCDWATSGSGDFRLWVVAHDNAGNSLESGRIMVTVDNDMPTMDSAMTTSVNTIEVVFSEGLDPATLVHTDFAADGFTVTGAGLADNVVTLNVSEMSTGDTPDVTYTQGVLADLAGNPVPTGTVKAEDGVAPEMLGAVTRTKTTIDVFFSEDLKWFSVHGSDFEVMNGEIPLAVIGASLDDDIVTLTVEGFGVDDTPTINLVGEVKDKAGNIQTEGSVTAIDGITPEVESINITLHQGWNFISVAKVLENPGVEDVLEGVEFEVISTYDPVNGWTIPAAIEPLNGYWILVNVSTVIALDYTTAIIPPARALHEGWNAIGTTYNDVMDSETALVSIDADYSHVVGWDVINKEPTGPGINGIPQGEQFSNADFDMVPGEGYWVAVTEDTTLMSLVY
jgi:hypothetical protein